MTDDAAKKKRELEHELTLTMTAQVSYITNIDQLGNSFFYEKVQFKAGF